MNMEGWQEQAKKDGQTSKDDKSRPKPSTRSSDETAVQREDSRPRDIEQGGKAGEKVGEKQQQPKSTATSGDNEQGGRAIRGDEEEDDANNDDPDAPPKDSDPNIVTWYGEKDAANPQNWSLLKKCWVTGLLCLLTFSIYIGSAIYSPGYQSLNQDFGVSSVVATLGLTLFVIGYGVGPLFLAPLSEIPQIGRNPPYVITLLIFVVIQAITANVTNFAGLMTLRFVAGFIGSPVLATGGASLQDMFSDKTRPYAIGIWGLAAVCGPVLGPLLGGFAIEANGWRWAFWILLWLDGFCLLMLLFFFPETSSTNILYRRAVRLRKRTGNQNLRSQGEIESSKMKGKDIVKMTLIAPFVLSLTEPICLVLNCKLSPNLNARFLTSSAVYIGLVYAILYAFIECKQALAPNIQSC